MGASLRREALPAAFGELGLGADPAIPMHKLAWAARTYLTSNAAAVAMQLDDVTQEATPVGRPPNWRHRLSMSLEEIAGVLAAGVRAGAE
jgi:hypothetical protein